jgi:hypothetical protein
MEGFTKVVIMSDNVATCIMEKVIYSGTEQTPKMTAKIKLKNFFALKL